MSLAISMKDIQGKCYLDHLGQFILFSMSIRRLLDFLELAMAIADDKLTTLVPEVSIFSFSTFSSHEAAKN